MISVKHLMRHLALSHSFAGFFFDALELRSAQAEMVFACRISCCFSGESAVFSAAAAESSDGSCSLQLFLPADQAFFSQSPLLRWCVSVSIIMYDFFAIYIFGIFIHI